MKALNVRGEDSPFKHELECFQWTPMFGADLSAIIIQLDSITNLSHVSPLSFFAAIEGLISKTLQHLTKVRVSCTGLGRMHVEICQDLFT